MISRLYEQAGKRENPLGSDIMRVRRQEYRRGQRGGLSLALCILDHAVKSSGEIPRARRSAQGRPRGFCPQVRMFARLP